MDSDISNSDISPSFLSQQGITITASLGRQNPTDRRDNMAGGVGSRGSGPCQLRLRLKLSTQSEELNLDLRRSHLKLGLLDTSVQELNISCVYFYFLVNISKVSLAGTTIIEDGMLATAGNMVPLILS
jgi:hypothetical protein